MHQYNSGIRKAYRVGVMLKLCPTRIRDKKMKKILMFVVIAFLMGGFVTKTYAMESSVTTEVTMGDEWDELLDEYESYVDQYVKLYKKAMSGDMSAMTEYSKLAAKAQKLAEKIADAQDDMSSAQLERYAKITKKMTDALK